MCETLFVCEPLAVEMLTACNAMWILLLGDKSPWIPVLDPASSLVKCGYECRSSWLQCAGLFFGEGHFHFDWPIKLSNSVGAPS